MKRILRLHLLSVILTLLFISFNEGVFSQGPPPPPPPNGGGNNGHGQGGNQGAGAPIGSGLEILIVLGAFYAGRKVYEVKKDEELGE